MQTPIPSTREQWDRLARKQLARLFRRAGESPTLRKRGPHSPWRADVQWVTQTEVARLNRKYRGKKGPTDILSFPAPEIFRELGYMGELVICLPVLKRQARERNHPAGRELEILLAHGLLHLLGFDHEKGAKEAAEMARWEERLLRGSPARGLIGRAAREHG